MKHAKYNFINSRFMFKSFEIPMDHFKWAGSFVFTITFINKAFYKCETIFWNVLANNFISSSL